MIELIRAEMLKCGDNCRCGILNAKDELSLMWRTGSNWHQERIAKSDCVIGSEALKQMLERARVALIY